MSRWTELSTDIIQDHELSNYGLRVYIAISSFMGSNGTAEPSIEELAECVDLSDDDVFYAVLELVESDWIDRKISSSGGEKYSFPSKKNRGRNAKTR